MARAELSDAARYDLWEIYSYYLTEAGTEVADRIRDEILYKFRLLSEHSLIGRSRPDILPNMRTLPHKKFVIFYFPKEYGVEIVRVIHSARDVESIIENEFLN